MPVNKPGDLGTAHLRNFMGERQPEIKGALKPGFSQQHVLDEHPQRGPEIYDPGPNQALKNRRDQGRGRFGTDEYYENKEATDPDFKPSGD